MKKKKIRVLKTFAIVAFMIIVTSCGTTAEDILKKYETYDEFQSNAIYFQATGNSMNIEYSMPLLNSNEEFVTTLADRWFVANAEKPEEILPVKIDSIVLGETNPTTYRHVVFIDNIKERFLLIGFKGIASTESVEAQIPPLFFLVENKKGELTSLTDTPKLADNLFEVNYVPMFFSEQEYSGEIIFERSKNVTLRLTLSADLKQVTKLIISADELHLTPANFDRQREISSGQESIFKYLDNSRLTTNLAITTISGINVMARDASGYPIVESLLFKGGFETTSPIDINDGKITLDIRPLICDLTVTNACIYGNVKVQVSGSGTKSVYVVLKNTTTPQEIPENILNN